MPDNGGYLQTGGCRLLKQLPQLTNSGASLAPHHAASSSGSDERDVGAGLHAERGVLTGAAAIQVPMALLPERSGWWRTRVKHISATALRQLDPACPSSGWPEYARSEDIGEVGGKGGAISRGSASRRGGDKWMERLFLPTIRASRPNRHITNLIEVCQLLAERKMLTAAAVLKANPDDKPADVNTLATLFADRAPEHAGSLGPAARKDLSLDGLLHIRRTA